jgi:hypothetical protein
MKRLKLSALLFLAVLLCCGIATPGETPNLSVQFWHWASRSPLDDVLSLYRPGTAPELYGVWVVVFVNDPEVEAVSVTLSYIDEAGRRLARTRLVRPHLEWSNVLFIVGKVKVQTVLAVPLKPTDKTVMLEPNET